MYAIVDIAGQQYKVEKKQKLFVHRLEGKEGSEVVFDKVLLIDNEGKISVGAPVVKNTIVAAKILSHLKGDKVKVFKKKRRKGYQVLNGHRQYLTEIEIEKIGEGTAPKKEPAAKTASEKKKPVTQEKPKAAAVTAEKTTTKKPAAKATGTKPAAKTSPKPKSTATKSASKKPGAQKTTAAKPAAKKQTASKKPAAKKPAAKKPDKKEE